MQGNSDAVANDALDYGKICPDPYITFDYVAASLCTVDEDVLEVFNRETIVNCGIMRNFGQKFALYEVVVMLEWLPYPGQDVKIEGKLVKSRAVVRLASLDYPFWRLLLNHVDGDVKQIDGFGHLSDDGQEIVEEEVKVAARAAETGIWPDAKSRTFNKTNVKSSFLQALERLEVYIKAHPELDPTSKEFDVTSTPGVNRRFAREAYLKDLRGKKKAGKRPAAAAAGPSTSKKFKH